MSGNTTTHSDPRAEWIVVRPYGLDKNALKPYAVGEIANLMDWAENPQGRSAHFMPHRGQFIVDIVEIEDNAVHQPSKPGDEVVVVLNGILRLTTDHNKAEQTFRRGDAVLIPAGWAGIYRVIAAEGPFREFTIVPGDYFEPDVAPPPTRDMPRQIVFSRATGAQEIHRHRYALELRNTAGSETWFAGGESDEIIQVHEGTLSLAAAENTATLGSGDVVILPKGVRCRTHASPGYRGLHAKWIV